MGFSSLTVNKCYFKNSPKAGLEPQTSESEATALPTEPQPLPNFGILSSSQPEKQTFREQFTAPEMSIVSRLMMKVKRLPNFVKSTKPKQSNGS